MPDQKLRIAVMVAARGRGSNMQAIVDACRAGQIPGEVVCVIGTAPGSPALERAAEQGIPTEVVPYNNDDPDEYGRRLLQTLEPYRPGLIALAGFLKRLPPVVVSAYVGRIMNIHPALIPSFCGQGMYGERVHQAAVDYGVKVSGCTVHFVDEGYDTGPIIAQAVVPVDPDDTALTLAAKVLKEEHCLYPECIRLFAEGRLRVEGRRVRILSEAEASPA